MYRSNVHTLQYLDTAGSEPACKPDARWAWAKHGLWWATGLGWQGSTPRAHNWQTRTQAEGRHPLPLQYLSQRNFVRGDCAPLDSTHDLRILHLSPSSPPLRRLCLASRVIRQAQKSPFLVLLWTWNTWVIIIEGACASANHALYLVSL